MASTSNIDAVIFDLGGVLISFDFERATSRVAKMVNLTSPEVRRRIIACEAFLDFECGKVTERQFHVSVEEALGHKVPFEVFHGFWNDIFDAEIAATVALVPLLRKSRIKVGLLSNTNVMHFEHLKPRMKVLSEMDHVFTSHEVGLRKPDPRIYQHVLKHMNVEASRSVFVDDLEENITAAKGVGMHGVHAIHADAVNAGLKALGVI